MTTIRETNSPEADGRADPEGGELAVAARRCGALAAVTALAWLLLAVPAHLVAGGAGLTGLTYAAVACAVPGCILFLGATVWPALQSPVSGVLAGMVIRMVAVLGVALAVRVARPAWGLAEFFAWLIALYLVTLMAETLILLRGGSRKPSAASKRLERSESGSVSSISSTSSTAAEGGVQWPAGQSPAGHGPAGHGPGGHGERA